jgi:hypothetical protein
MITIEDTFEPLLLWVVSLGKVAWHACSMLIRIKTVLGQSAMYNPMFAGIPDEA